MLFRACIYVHDCLWFLLFSVCFHLIFVFVWRSLCFFCFTLFVGNDVGAVVIGVIGLFDDCLLRFFVITFMYIHKDSFALFGWVVCLLLLFIFAL